MNPIIFHVTFKNFICTYETDKSRGSSKIFKSHPKPSFKSKSQKLQSIENNETKEEPAVRNVR